MRGQRAKLLWVAPDCRHRGGSRSCEGETSGVRPGGAVRQDALEGGADTVRTVQDVFGEQPQRRVAALQSRHIAAAILLVNRPGAVELLAVALDDEPSIDQQVDTTHTLDTNLEFDTAAELTQKKANQRLGPRFGARVQQRAQDVESTGDACEDLADVRFIDEPEVPGVIERGDRRPWRLASDRLRERFDDVDGGTVPWRRRRTPVVDETSRGAGGRRLASGSCCTWRCEWWWTNTPRRARRVMQSSRPPRRAAATMSSCALAATNRPCRTRVRTPSATAPARARRDHPAA